MKHGTNWSCYSKERKQKWDVTVLKCIKGGQDNLFAMPVVDRMGNHGLKLQRGRFQLDIRKSFFVVRLVKHCNRFAKEVMQSTRIQGL